MECPSCKSDWNANKTVSQNKLKNCPFCGASLITEEKFDTTTIEGILRSIIQNHGENIYAATNFKAYISDYAAKFPKERKLIGLAISEEIPNILLDANEKSEDERQTAIKECIFRLQDHLCMEENGAKSVVNMLAEGLGWNSKNTDRDIDVTKTNQPTKKTPCSELTKFPKDFIYIESGTFQMGRASGYNDEKPIHSVTVSSYYICDHEVTQEEYYDIMRNRPSYFYSKGNNYPVECISWYNAVDYCIAQLMVFCSFSHSFLLLLSHKISLFNKRKLDHLQL